MNISINKLEKGGYTNLIINRVLRAKYDKLPGLVIHQSVELLNSRFQQ